MPEAEPNRIPIRNRNQGTSLFNFVLLFVAFVGVFVLSGLFAFWIATRNWHWFVRATILIISPLPLLLVEANDLMLILIVSQLVILIGVVFEQARKDRVAQLDSTNPNRLWFTPKFQISDLILTLAITCALAALLSQSMRFRFLELVHLMGIGTAIGVWSLVSIGLVYWKFPWGGKMGLGLIAMTGSLIWAALDDRWLIPQQLPLRPSGQTQVLISWLLLLTTISGFLLIMLLLQKVSVRPLVREAASQMSPTKKLLRCFAAGLLFSMGLSFAWSTMICYVNLLRPPETPKSSGRIVPGEPNGFDEIADAGLEFYQSPLLSTTIPVNPCQQLRNEIRAYSKSFDKVQSGLSRKTQSCIDLLTVCQDDDAEILDRVTMDKIQNIRSASRALSVKARQEIYDRNYDDAIHDGLSCIKMAQCLNDCIMVTHLVGIACEGLGSYPIQIAIKYATTPVLKEAAQTLNQADVQSSTFQQVITNEQFHIWETSDWKDRLFVRAQGLTLQSPHSNLIKVARARRDAIRAQLRTAIAIELYKRVHDSYPDALDQLVPDFMDEVLKDPFPLDAPRKPLRYKTLVDGSYILYSVSKNGIDENGIESGRLWVDGDLNFAEIVRLDELETRKSADDYAQALKDNAPQDQE